VERWRVQVAAGLRGRIVEIGFGSGLNLEYYPSEVDVVLAVEPAALAKKLAAKRIAGSPIPVMHIGLDGQAIPLEDASCDGALVTFTLCTVPDAYRVLVELRRVLSPGGSLHFLEHGLAPDESVARWQRRLDPIQGLLAGGCHLTRDPLTLINDAGFDIDSFEQRYALGPKPWSYFTVGIATRPTG
jgi:ubiquinone/menaquinone biosynthesis C-methylase UbiE